MPNKTAKPVIFISYSHKDEPDKPAPDEVPWLTFVQSFLAPVVKTGIFDIWVDQHLHGSDDLDSEIKTKLDNCDIFVLLASRHSLASTYVVETEIATMRQRIANGEDVRIFPIILSPVPNVALKQLKDLVLKPKDGQPLSLMPKNDREVSMAAIADDIAVVAEEISKRKIGQKSGASKLVGALLPSDFRPKAFASGKKVTVDISHLPETPYEHLVGRDAELKRFDDAWSDVSTNILSVIAEGGGGKSALVNEWLKRLQINGYRGAEAVFGWSFYNQGTKERAASGDEFLDWALNRLDITLKSTSASAKGEAIAEQMVQRRILLLLDGVEPLQHGLGVQIGQLNDEGLRSLLRRFAATPLEAPHSMIVLTSRLAVKDIGHWHDRAAPVVNIERLSNDAGAALLRDNSVWGTDQELKAAAHDFDGYPLALGLLASFLKETQTGDVRRRDHIRSYFDDAENARHDHARRVMESYEKEWLAGQPVLLAIMHMVGLFDRPASRKSLFALRRPPMIHGLTDQIVNLDNKKWERAIARLREVRLLAPPESAAPDALDAHPLVREWFSERLRKTNKMAWEVAHGRLYEHLRDTTKEGKTPTLESLGPLYQAIMHGCCADRRKESLHDVYEVRICQNRPQVPTFYSRTKLGAFGSNLAAISWFFEQPYTSLPPSWAPKDQSWLLNEAATCLAAQGRYQEALPPQRAALQLSELIREWSNAAINASNLSDTELVVGHIADAIDAGRKAIVYSNRAPQRQTPIGTRGSYADALHASGNRDEAYQLFAEAERYQRSLQPAYPLVYSKQGYHYCDFLISIGEISNALNRATRTLQWAKRSNFPRDIALDILTLGRANHAHALERIQEEQTSAETADYVRVAHDRLNDAIEGLRVGGEVRFMAAGMLARAAFHRSIGDWDGAARDLDEVEEIAEPGPMRLHLCDMARERAVLAFARIEAFAPLNGLIDTRPPKPERPGEAERKSLHAEAAKQLAIAVDYIEKCGYHRRDEELAELQAVLHGERTFAGLPLRV